MDRIAQHGGEVSLADGLREILEQRRCVGRLAKQRAHGRGSYSATLIYDPSTSRTTEDGGRSVCVWARTFTGQIDFSR